MRDSGKQKSYKDTIVIDSSSNDNLDKIVTISAQGLKDKDACGDCDYKISPDGKVIFNNLSSDLSNLAQEHIENKTPKESLIDELTKHGFEKIPADLNEEQLKGILEFYITKVVKNIEYGQLYPFSVEKTDNGDLTVILLMYNRSTLPFALGSLPFKLKDANNNVVFADLVNLDKVVDSNKVGIYYIKIDREYLKEENMDLSTWTITFEAE